MERKIYYMVVRVDKKFYPVDKLCSLCGNIIKAKTTAFLITPFKSKNGSLIFCRDCKRKRLKRRCDDVFANR